MQGLADGYFVIPYTIANYLAEIKNSRPSTDHEAFREAEESVSAKTRRLLENKGSRSADSFHKELGRIMWDHCGMARNKDGLEEALKLIPELREKFWEGINVPGSGQEFNQSLERAGRIADFLELGELMCRDALEREESCGGHFREEHQTEDGEALRHDERFSFVSAWNYQGDDKNPSLIKEDLVYEEIKMATRSYK